MLLAGAKLADLAGNPGCVMVENPDDSGNCFEAQTEESEKGYRSPDWSRSPVVPLTVVFCEHPFRDRISFLKFILEQRMSTVCRR